MNDIVLILIGVAMGLFGFLLLWELDNIAEQGGIGVRVIISLRKRIRELMDENAKLKAEIEQRADHESYLSQEFANTYYEKNARIDDLEAEVVRLKAEQRWRRLAPKNSPKDRVWVLVLIGDEVYRAQKWGGHWRLDTNKFVSIYPSKWMPLPEPPEVK